MKKNTILIADDCEVDANHLKRLLLKCEVQNPIQIVRDGVEVVAYLTGEGDFADREKYPEASIIFLDLKMHLMDGFEFLEWIQGQPHLKKLMVIVLSGLHRVEDYNRAYQLGAHTFLAKPCRMEDLENMMTVFDCWKGLPIRATKPGKMKQSAADQPGAA